MTILKFRIIILITIIFFEALEFLKWPSFMRTTGYFPVFIVVIVLGWLIEGRLIDKKYGN
jgi:hypothetical protein